jgi:hypothetical protein
VLEQLVLDKNGLTDVGAARVADMFMTCPRLKRLSLAQNDKMQEVARICEKRARLSEDQVVEYL